MYVTRSNFTQSEANLSKKKINKKLTKTKKPKKYFLIISNYFHPKNISSVSHTSFQVFVEHLCFTLHAVSFFAYYKKKRKINRINKIKNKLNVIKQKGKIRKKI